MPTYACPLILNYILAKPADNDPPISNAPPSGTGAYTHESVLEKATEALDQSLLEQNLGLGRLSLVYHTLQRPSRFLSRVIEPYRTW